MTRLADKARVNTGLQQGVRVNSVENAAKIAHQDGNMPLAGWRCFIGCRFDMQRARGEGDFRTVAFDNGRHF